MLPDFNLIHSLMSIERISPPLSANRKPGISLDSVSVEPMGNTANKVEELNPNHTISGTPIESQADAQVLTLGDRSAVRIQAKDVKPGDIICTYESTSTNPLNFGISLFQKLLFGEKNVNKMTHFEIILEGPSEQNGNKVKVAHADGLSGKITVQEQDFSKFTAGTSIVVMRSKKEGLPEKLAEVAQATADRGNKWRMKPFHDMKNLTVGKVLKFIKNKFFVSDEKRALKKFARMAVDSNHTFYKKDGRSQKDMNCVQYVNSVLNASLLRTNPEFQEIIENEEYKALIDQWEKDGKSEFEAINSDIESLSGRIKESENEVKQLKKELKQLNKKDPEYESVESRLNDAKRQLDENRGQLSSIKQKRTTFLKEGKGKVLIDLQKKRQDMISKLSAKFKEKKLPLAKLQKELSSGGLHDQVTSASLILHMLNNQEDWNLVGYIGENADAPPPSNRIVEPKELNSKDVENLGYGQHEHVRDTFAVCGLLDQDKKFVGDVNGLQTRTAFNYLYAQKYDLPPFVVADFLSSSGESRNKIGLVQNAKAEVENNTARFILEARLEVFEIEDLTPTQKIEKQRKEIDVFFNNNPELLNLSEKDKDHLIQILLSDKEAPDIVKMVKPFFIAAYAEQNKLPPSFVKKLCENGKMLERCKQAHANFQRFQAQLHQSLFPKPSIPSTPAPADESNQLTAASEIDQPASENTEPSIEQFTEPSVDSSKIEPPKTMVPEKVKDQEHTTKAPQKIDIRTILGLQKYLIKNSTLSRGETAETWDINAVTVFEQKTKRISFNAKLVIGAAIALFPITIAVGIIALPIIASFEKGRAALMLASGLSRVVDESLPTEKNAEVWKAKIRILHNLHRPNFNMKLESQVPLGRRPWITYSPDGGKTWKAQPLVLQPGSEKDWEANVYADTNEKLEYKYFIGPNDANHSDPLQGAQWQEGDNNTFDSKDFSGNKSQTGLIAAPVCVSPNWRS